MFRRSGRKTFVPGLRPSMRTGGFVVWFFQTFFPHVPYVWYDLVHTFLRKLGHFTNYAILSWLWFRAARYWDLPRVATGDVRAALDDAVRVRLRADVPICVQLSGGIDSSAVAGSPVIR